MSQFNSQMFRNAFFTPGYEQYVPPYLRNPSAGTTVSSMPGRMGTPVPAARPGGYIGGNMQTPGYVGGTSLSRPPMQYYGGSSAGGGISSPRSWSESVSSQMTQMGGLQPGYGPGGPLITSNQSYNPGAIGGPGSPLQYSSSPAPTGPRVTPGSTGFGGVRDRLSSLYPSAPRSSGFDPRFPVHPPGGWWMRGEPPPDLTPRIHGGGGGFGGGFGPGGADSLLAAYRGPSPAYGGGTAIRSTFPATGPVYKTGGPLIDPQRSIPLPTTDMRGNPIPGRQTRSNRPRNPRGAQTLG